MQKLAWVSLLLLVVLCLAAPAQAQNVDCGVTGAGLSSVSAFNNLQDGISCTTGANSGGYTVNSCSIRVGALGVDANQLRCAIYTDAADPNKALLCQGGPMAATANATNTITLTGCGTLAASTTYWISWNTNDAGLNYRDTAATACAGASGSSFFRTWTFGAAPSPWGTRTADTCQLVMSMNLTPVAGGAAPKRLPLLGVGALLVQILLRGLTI